MTASSSITVSGPEDILGYIPHSLGYWPADSLVALTFQGNRIGATLRVDLPSSINLEDLAQYAGAVRQYLEADRKADGVVLAVFSTNEWNDLPRVFGPLLEALGRELGENRLGVRDAWFVGDDYWRDALCLDRSCCPWPGRPLEEIRDSRLNAELVFRGSSVGTAPGPPMPSSAIPRVDPAEEDWFVAMSDQSASRTQFLQVLVAWKHVLERPVPDDLSPEQLAYLRATLRVPAWRDAVLVMGAAGQAAALDGAERFGIFDGAPDVALPLLFPGLTDGTGDVDLPPASQDDIVFSAADQRAGFPGADGHGSPVAPGYGEVLLGLAPAKPDWKSLDALERVLQRLAEGGGGVAGAAALTGSGWIAWCRGRGSYAGAFLRQALEVVPGYRLAELLDEMVGRGSLCGWAADPQSAWQKFREDAA